MRRAGISLDIAAWRLGLLAGFLLLWEVAVRGGWIDRFHVSQPSLLSQQTWKWIASGYIFRHLWVTMEEMLLGFLVGTLLGILIGFVFAFVPRVAQVFDPLMVLLNALPRVVLAPLFVLWFGLGLLSKVVMAVSLVFFVVFFSTYTGLREVDRDIVNYARILGGSRRDLIWHVYVPSTMTWIFSSLRTSVGFALIGAVVGEYLGASEGMGWVIAYAYRNEIKSPKYLKGRLVGVTAPGSATDLLTRYMMAKEGIRPEDMKIIGVGTNTIVPAVENDQVVAAMGVDTWVTQIVKRGRGFLLVDLRTEKDTRTIFGGPYQFTGLLAREDIIEKRPAMIQKVVNALVKANKWMAANPVEKWADVLPSEMLGDRATWIESMKAAKEMFTSDSLPTAEGVMSVLRAFEMVGQIPDATKMDPNGLIDTRFVKRALERK